MVKIRDFDLREVSDVVALVTYRTIGQEGRESLRSSIWLLGDSGWQIVFHQRIKVQNRFHDRQGVPTRARGT
jgi:hypothetical protein